MPLRTLESEFLSDIGREEFQQRSQYVCGDCRYFLKEKKCPINVQYKLASVCFYYRHSKEQRIYMKSLEQKGKEKFKSLTIQKVKKKRKKSSHLDDSKSKKIYINPGFIRCNLQYAYRLKIFLEDLIKKESWKCRRSRCKDKQLFQVHVESRRYKVEEDVLYHATDRMIDFTLICPSCRFIHNFPKDILKEIKEKLKEIKSLEIFPEKPKTHEDRLRVLNYVKGLVYLSGFERNPLYIYTKETKAYRTIAGKISKLAKKYDVKNSDIVGVVGHADKSCFILWNGSFVLIPIREGLFLIG